MIRNHETSRSFDRYRRSVSRARNNSTCLLRTCCDPAPEAPQSRRMHRASQVTEAAKGAERFMHPHRHDGGGGGVSQREQWRGRQCHIRTQPHQRRVCSSDRWRADTQVRKRHCRKKGGAHLRACDFVVVPWCGVWGARMFVWRVGLSEMWGRGAGTRPGVCAYLFKKTCG